MTSNPGISDQRIVRRLNMLGPQPGKLRSSTRRPQAGLTMLGLIFWAIVISFSAIVGLRVVPTINEYYAIQRMVDKVARDGGSTVPEIRAAFERMRQVEYGVESMTGSDLDITKEQDRVVVGFAYDKQIELAGPVYLLIKYEGRSR
jgi:Domain of unknown function (DUF4845)